MSNTMYSLLYYKNAGEFNDHQAEMIKQGWMLHSWIAGGTDEAATIMVLWEKQK